MTTRYAVKRMRIAGHAWAKMGPPVSVAQNLAAIRILATEGVQRGHMSLHAKNIAAMAGATGKWIDEVAKRLAQEGKVRVDRAKEILDELVKK